MTAAVAVPRPELNFSELFVGPLRRWFTSDDASSVLGVSSRTKDDALASKLVIRRRFGKRGALHYIKAPNVPVYVEWLDKLPYEPEDQESMLKTPSLY